MSATDTNSLEAYEKWSGRQLIRKLQIELEMIESRRASGEPLKADEVTVMVPRDHYEKLCRLSLDRLTSLLREAA